MYKVYHILLLVQVDIFQVCVIEMKDREGSPLFHLEHFIEGKYIKYNSNSGFVLQDETLRCTPQVCLLFGVLKKMLAVLEKRLPSLTVFTCS